MKRIALILLIASISDTETRAQSIESASCTLVNLDSFDTKVFYRIIDGQLDTVEQKLKKGYAAFKPCRINTYRAIYASKKGVELSNELIRTLATGNRWEHQPAIQHELLINYPAQDSDEQTRLKDLALNKTLSSTWVETEVTGVIENEEQVWMHPFRSNQYSFTEVAPFPEIILPAQIGTKWTSEIQIGQGWGDWENTTWKHKYKIVEQATRTYPFGSLDNCIKISAISSNKKFGKSKLDLWYHESYGFVEFNYQNYEGQQLSIVLEGTEMK